MKKLLLFIITALTLLCLTACGGTKPISGRVIERTMDGDSLSSFIVETQAGKKAQILITDTTGIFSSVDGIDAEAFKSADAEEMDVLVYVHGKSQAVTTQSGEKLKAYAADFVDITSALLPETLSLSDGTVLSIRQTGSSKFYYLPDGTELLRQEHSSGPDNVYVGGLESFNDLSDAAKEKILAYYDEQGLLYNIQDELENAYKFYQTMPEGSNFSSSCVGMDISPSASGERVIYFLTNVMLPTGSGTYTERHLGEAFDRETGEHIDNLSLFSCDEDELKKILFADTGDEALKKELLAAFRPETIVFFSDNLEVSFPQGSLPSQEYMHTMGLDYDEKLSAVLQPWAIPQKAE